MTLQFQDLLDALEAAEDPVARKRLKAAIYALADPDPLTVPETYAGNRNAPGRRQAPDLHDQHPARRDRRGRTARLRRWLDRLGLVRRVQVGGTK